jgi:SAM-dependent methyltransferase
MSTTHFPGNTDLQDDYDVKGRFSAYWHQIDEVRKLHPRNCLEVGVGTGFVAHYLQKQGIRADTLDINVDLRPTIVGSVTAIPCPDAFYDVIACCQVLEHLPYEEFEPALRELRRVSRGKMVLSLPDLERRYPFMVSLPKLGQRQFLLEMPRFRRMPWTFNGEHYWNIGTGEHPLPRIEASIQATGWRIQRQYCVFEMPWHRFFILDKV